MNISELNAGGQPDSIEYAGIMLDRHDLLDSLAPGLLEVTGISQHRLATASGLNDYDYQNLSTLSAGHKNLNQLETVNKVSIPNEVMEHFKHIKCHCMMGIFPEIGRAWLTIDSDIYIWTYEHARDVAYFDGLNHLIVSVGLVKPKPGVFIADVKYLLILTTPTEIVVLGVTFGDTNKLISSPQRHHLSGSLLNSTNYEEMQLMSKPIFILNTDNVAITTIVSSTEDNRIFLGGRDGCLYEIVYQAESNWFGKRCKKINHSQSVMSYIMPGFLKVFSEIDAITKIVVDNSRNMLYTLTEKGAIEAWDIDRDHSSTRRIARISQNDIVFHASNVLKTVDSSAFKPVVAICPLTIDDSPNLHLLAITQGGVRLYFATVPLNFAQQQQQPQHSPQMDSLKPQNLYLLHVRLPPGYTPNATVGKPKSVHTAFYSQGSLLMVSTPQQDQDLLWSLSSEPFPMRPYLAESSTVLPLNGQVWSIAEVAGEKSSSSSLCNSLKSAKTNKNVVLLTNQGVQIISLVKPVDMLQQLLIACHGPHHEAVKSYFQIQSEPQACATSLLLACMESFKGTEMGMWATQAFLLYGGEPHFGNSYLMNQSQAAGQPGTRNLNMSGGTFFEQQQPRSPQMSTPYPSASRPASAVHQSLFSQYPLSPILASQGQNYTSDPTNITYSAKHAGLYLHISRLLRSIWKKRCCTPAEGGHQNSSISHLDCADILDDLYAVRSFIEQLPMSGSPSSYLQNQNTVVNGGRNTVEHAYAEEKRSVNALLQFIKHACEVIGLWKILCEHQFSVLLLTLPKEEQSILSSCTFRDLILSRADTCALLIVSLINTYLNDNATVGSISAKLREVCPNLYRHEDAVSHKATEILMLSKNCTDAEEQRDKLYTALQLCKDAAPNLPLSNICQQFTVANFYQGVIELCATCAAKIDPNGVALHFYKNMEPIEDQEGFMAFSMRMNFYKEIKVMLDQFYQKLIQSSATLELKKPQPSRLETGEVGGQLNEQILGAVTQALQTPDKLLHIAVYEWLLGQNLLSELLDISEPSLGEFLTHSVAKNPDNLHLADILWKYHELNGQHSSATKILDNLATMPSTVISLAQRIDYLARAVMCMRSDSVGYSAHNGVMLKNLEDKLEIARVQKLILHALSIECNSGNSIDEVACREAVQNLNYTLYNITQLYTDFAERFELWECKLTILNCAHHNDPLLIESVWTQILNNAIEPPGSPYERATRMLLKVQSLAKEYGKSGHCFPIAFLVHEVELRCCKLKLTESPVPNALVNSMDLDIDQLLDIYSRMISMSERCWAAEGNEWHLVQSTTSLVTILANQPQLIAARNRRRVVSKAKDLTSACRTLLYPKPDTKYLTNALLEIEARLERI